MGAIIIPFETRAQREERLHYELMTAYRTYIRVEAPVTRDAFFQALDRLVAFQMRHSRPRWCESRDECSTGSQATVALERARGGSRRGSSKAGH
jgi:hypothetical protein